MRQRQASRERPDGTAVPGSEPAREALRRCGQPGALLGAKAPAEVHHEQDGERSVPGRDQPDDAPLPRVEEREVACLEPRDRAAVARHQNVHDDLLDRHPELSGCGSR